MSRYEIETSKEADPDGTRLLRRSFARLAVVGPPARVALECERLFAAAWYDAFGPRGSTHTGTLAPEPGSRSLESLAA